MRKYPRRVYAKHGALWYVDYARKWHRLGPLDLSPAAVLRAVAGLLEQTTQSQAGTMAAVFLRYRREVLIKKAARTQHAQALELARLEKVFGRTAPRDVGPPDVWSYFNARGASSAAHHEVRLLSHVFTWARRWGLVELNPAQRLGLPTPKPRVRYVTDEEFLTVRALAPPMVGYAMDLALLTGLRQGDILALERKHLSEQGVTVQTSKTGRALLFEWSPELRATIDGAMACQVHSQKALQLQSRTLQLQQLRRWVIAGRGDKRITSSGFQTQWQRLMARAVEAGVERFTFHDLRAKSLSDEESLAAAATRAGHADPRITQRVYRRLPDKVKPLARPTEQARKS